MTPRTLGRLIGGTILVGVVGIVVVGFMRRAASEQHSSAGRDSIPDLRNPGSSHIADLPGEGGAVQDIVAMADQAAVTRVDPVTGELRYKFEWNHMEPDEAGVFQIDAPRAWVLEQDQVMIITSSTGRVIWPSRDAEPESGLLEGKVKIQVFDQSWEGAAESKVAPDGIEPVVVLETESLSFNTTFGEVGTEVHFDLIGPGLKASGTGLKLRFSNNPSTPITFLSIKEHGRVELFENNETQDTRAATGDRKGNSSEQAPGEADTPPVEAFYSARFEGGVRLRAGQQTLRGEVVELWARLEDGHLPQGALASWSGSEQVNGRSSRGSDPVSQSQSRGAESPTTALLEWDGPFELRLLSEAPQQLASDDVFLQVHSRTSEALRITDAESGASIDCLTLEYGATRRVVSLFGVGPLGVTIRVPDLVEVVTGRLDLDLTTGIGAIPSPGIASALGASLDINDPLFSLGDRPRDLRWSERADFVLDTSAGPVGASGRVVPIELLLSGRVEARDGLSVLKGDTIKLEFDEVTLAGVTEPVNTMSRLEVNGRAEALEALGGRVLAESITIDFEPSASTGQPQPVLATCRGNVRATRADQSLRAGMVEMQLAPSIDGRDLEFQSLDARLGVEITLSEAPVRPEPGQPMFAPAKIIATGDRVRASGTGNEIELIGDPARITRSFGDESSEVTGPLIHISADQDLRRLKVVGPGTVLHRFSRVKEDGYGQIHLEWNTSLDYDDLTMEGEAIGDVVATADFGETERHIARGQSVKLRMFQNAAKERELGFAIIEGHGAGQAPAEVEMRQYVGDADAAGVRTLESMAFLRGQKIVLNAVEGLLDVPTPGLLLIENRRGDDDPSGEGGAPGTTLLEWDGSFHASRGTGLGTIVGRAQLRHREPGGSAMTEVESEWMEVALQWPEPGSGSDQLKLMRAEARGAVYARRDTLELVCDLLIHDAVSGVLQALANDGNRITLLDTLEGRHIFAEAIELDLANGSWGRITRPTATLLPR